LRDIGEIGRQSWRPHGRRFVLGSLAVWWGIASVLKTLRLTGSNLVCSDERLGVLVGSRPRAARARATATSSCGLRGAPKQLFLELALRYGEATNLELFYIRSARLASISHLQPVIAGIRADRNVALNKNFVHTANLGRVGRGGSCCLWLRAQRRNETAGLLAIELRKSAPR
jgi:hypothetical protein